MSYQEYPTAAWEGGVGRHTDRRVPVTSAIIMVARVLLASLPTPLVITMMQVT